MVKNKVPYFLKSEDGQGSSLKSIIAFFSWLAVTSVFLRVAYLQGKDFNGEFFYYYTFASLVGYGPKLITKIMMIWKCGDTKNGNGNGDSPEEKKEEVKAKTGG